MPKEEGSVTPEELEAIRARVAAATPGPWTFQGLADDRQKMLAGTVFFWKTPQIRALLCALMHNDGVFCAAARKDIPDLLVEVDRLTKENATMADENTRLQHALTACARRLELMARN